MLTIHKYPIEIAENQELSIKGYSQLLSVIEQDGRLVVYAYIHTDSEITKTAYVSVFGTGQEITGEVMFNWHFLGTVQTKNGFVWHVYYTNHGR